MSEIKTIQNGEEIQAYINSLLTDSGMAETSDVEKEKLMQEMADELIHMITDHFVKSVDLATLETFDIFLDTEPSFEEVIAKMNELSENFSEIVSEAFESYKQQFIAKHKS